MRLLLLLLLVFSKLCTAGVPPEGRDWQSRMPDGVWVGEMTTSSHRPDRDRLPKTQTIIVAACSGIARVWFKLKDGSFSSPTSAFRTESMNSSHLIRLIHAEPVSDPTWTEVQTLQLVEGAGFGLTAIWSRAVNNRIENDGDPPGAVFDYGHGSLARTSDKCDLDGVYGDGRRAV